MTDTLASRADGADGTSAFTYDWANRELTATSPVATGTTTTAYRLDGLIATRIAGNAETATLTYDPVKRPINVAYTTGGALWQTYDRLGNVTAEGRTLTGVSGNAGTGSQAFTYDAVGRVTKATIPGTNTTCGQTGVACYGYDRNGNRTTKQVNAVTTTYTYHPTDEIETQTISGVIKTFTYNLYGSQTTAFDAANATTTSAYDTAERLLTVTPPTGGAASYGYDALGRITTKTIGASIDTYSYLGSSETAWQIANTGGTGFTTKSALDATGARTAVTNGALTGYLGFDLHGNTALAENGSKTITDALRYDAWGELIASTTSALPTPWRYQGRLDVGPEAANPLYDFGARTYRPVTGAFTSLDSYAGQVIDPLSMNRFLYAEANPATFVDPDGHGVDCGLGEQCSATDRSSDLAASSARTAPRPGPAASESAIETAYITKKVGGAWSPISLNAFNQMGAAGQIAYARLFGSRAEDWLDDNAYTDAIFANAGAFVTADLYELLTNRERYAATGSGVFIEDYVTADQALNYPGSPTANFAIVFMTAGVVSAYTGALTDSPFATLGGAEARGLRTPGRGSFGPEQYHGREGSGGGQVRPLRASQLEAWAQANGWTRTQRPDGPVIYVDRNGIRRVTLKSGSERTPGSESPHAEFRDASGKRIDLNGDPVTRRSRGNHTFIEWDLE